MGKTLNTKHDFEKQGYIDTKIKINYDFEKQGYKYKKLYT